jgi:uncharacterized protein YndB with AHSA1/START domain
MTETADHKATLHQRGEHHSLRFERRLAHPPERVWRALTDNADLACWFPAQIHGERAAGARLCFQFPDEPGPEVDDEMRELMLTAQQQAQELPAEAAPDPMTGQLLVFDPPRVLEFSWGEETLRFELEGQGGGTRLVFTHTFTDLAKSARDASGWEVCFDALDNYLAGLPPAPFTMDRFEELFASYARRFGAAASAKRTPEGLE